MDGVCEQFINECDANNTTVAVFIRLFNMWDRLNSDQRGKIIESEIKKGRLHVER